MDFLLEIIKLLAQHQPRAIATWHGCGVRVRQRPQVEEISPQNTRALAVEELFRGRVLLREAEARLENLVICCYLFVPLA